MLIATTSLGHAAPPALEFQFDTVATGARQLEAGGPRISDGASQAITGSLLARQPLSAKGLYWGYGLQAEKFSFEGNKGLPRRLQDYAAVFALEYYEGTEPVAALILRPGWYFADRVTANAWDVPVDLTTGLPIARNLNGAIGFSNSRFYHHPLPIVGVVWMVNEHVRIEAIYPEPAVVFTLSATCSLRLGGELTGGAFPWTAPRGAPWSNTRAIVSAPCGARNGVPILSWKSAQGSRPSAASTSFANRGVCTEAELVT